VPKKPKLGQNFLIDEDASRRIAESLGDTTDRTVVEIGPGHGAITDLLAPRTKHLHCIELDPTLARELTFRFRNNPHVTIHQADILQTNLSALIPYPLSLIPALDVLGNLPYYITSDILLHLFASARQNLPDGQPLLHRAVLMMQREVADRIAALPGTSDYGPLSAATQLHAQVTNLFTLPPAAFNPPPDVYSTVVRLDFAPRFTELGLTPEDFEPFNRFLRSGFAQKRKTLSNNLRNAGYTAAQLTSAWPETLPPQARAEAVALPAMADLYCNLTPPSRS
jgi:16S rRNA (adenine1518-N6/adenine1519-N6)-dimethyltransferase